MRYLFVILLAWLHVQLCYVQIDFSEYSLNELKKFASELVTKGDIYLAIDFYEKIVAEDNANTNSRYTLAELYREAHNYKKAANEYKRVYETDKQKYILGLYYYGTMEMDLGNYVEAEKALTSFKNQYNINDEYAKLAIAHIEGCKMASNISLDTLSFIHLGNRINRAHGETSPFSMDPNTLLYSSFPIDSVVIYGKNRPVITKRMFQATRSDKNAEWKYQGKSEFNKFIDNNSHLNNVFITNDGQHLFITKCAQNAKYKYICRIYHCKKENGQWPEPKLIENLAGDEYTCTQPAIRQDTLTKNLMLYYVSDKPGGQGRNDIWFCTYDSITNTFSESRNAGSTINTVGDEMTPYFDDETMTLYFSSDGHPGIGGFDVFKSVADRNEWSAPKNLGKPFNTSADDLGYIIGKSKYDGFLFSNRDGSIALKNPNCCHDLYYFENEIITACTRGKVYDIADQDLIELLNRKFNMGLKYNLENEYVDNVTVKLFEKREADHDIQIDSDTTKNGGNYFFNLEPEKDYFVLVSNYGYFDKRYRFTTKKMTKSDTIKIPDIGINKLPDGPMRFYVNYEFDKADLTPDARIVVDTTLTPLFKIFSKMKVEISAHTDSKGTDEYNIKLSQKRAESVVNYLITKGVDPRRMIAKGYGESQPIAPNENPDGSDNPEGRAKNRRSEIRIIGSVEDLISSE